jgi:HEAT repeat protein
LFGFWYFVLGIFPPATIWLALAIPALAQAPATWEGKTVRQWAEQLEAADAGANYYAAYVLGQLGPQAADAVEPLKKMLQKRSVAKSVPGYEDWEYVRGTAAWALGRIGPAADSAVPLLMETMHSKGHVSVRRNSNEALGNLAAAAKPAVPDLLAALADEDAITRVNAAVALWKIQRHPKALPALVEMLRQEKGPAAYHAAVALGTLELSAPGTPEPPAADPARICAEALVKALGAADPDVARAAARSLGQIGRSVPRVALPAIQPALEGPRDEVRRMAAEALGWMGPAAVEPLRAVLKNDSPAARRAAARALGRLGPAARTAEADLVEAVNDPDAEVRTAAAKALRLLRGESPTAAGQPPAE